MNRAALLCIGALLLALAIPSDALARPTVRVQVSQRTPLVGSPLKLRVAVYVPTWFTSAIDYPSFELAGLVVRLPPDSSFNVRERIGGETQVGIVREYWLYPMQAARYEIDGQFVGVHYAHPETRKPVNVRLKIPTARFEAVVPEPAADLDPFIATRRLDLEQSFEGELEAPAVGDAITRELTVTVRDLPAMFLPPLLGDQAAAGLRAYASNPIVEDTPGRTAGRSVGRRIESVTYVIEEPGEHVLPAIELRWWNRRTGQVERSELPPLAFAVPAPPVVAAPEPPEPTWSPERLAVPVAAGLLAALVLFAFRRRLRNAARRWRERRARHRVSEPVRFKQLTRAVRRAPPDEVYRHLAVWLKTATGERRALGALEGRAGCEALAQSIAALEQTLYRYGTAPPARLESATRKNLRAALRDARGVLLARRIDERDGHGLPSLNPG